MRAEVIIDGEPVDRTEFHCAPRAGDEVLVKEGGDPVVVRAVRHNLAKNRLQVMCETACCEDAAPGCEDAPNEDVGAANTPLWGETSVDKDGIDD